MDLVTYEIREAVGVVSLNRPERHNAWNDELARALRATLREAMKDRAVRAILLRGEGRSFSSGRDTGQIGQRARGESDHTFVRAAQEFGLEFFETPKPTVVAMKGYNFGGALELCLRCDIRIGSTDLVVAMPEILFGLIPDTGGTQLLTAVVGPGRAKEIVMTGGRVDAKTAYEWGIVNRLVEPERLDAETFAIARGLAAGPPLALSIAKALINDAWAGQIRSGTRQELLAQALLFTTADYREAREARAEKRSPKYQGR
jgi:enoyl-CoA hydratase/carnithine racemase